MIFQFNENIRGINCETDITATSARVAWEIYTSSPFNGTRVAKIKRILTRKNVNKQTSFVIYFKKNDVIITKMYVRANSINDAVNKADPVIGAWIGTSFGRSFYIVKEKDNG